MDIPIPPGVNQYKKYRIIYQGGRPIISSYLTKEAEDFKQYMHYVMTRKAKECNWITPLNNQYIKMSLIFFMNKLGKDADNHIKLIQDSLQETGLVKNDSKIIPVIKRLYVDKQNPRVKIKLEILPWIGVFDNNEKREQFLTNNCINCKRYKRNCSILKALDNNKLIPEVNVTENICKKLNYLNKK